MSMHDPLDLWSRDPSPSSASDLLQAALGEREEDEARGGTGSDRLELWRRFLDESSRCEFLTGLDVEERERTWTSLVLWAIRRADYTLNTLLERRALEEPDRPYLVETVGGRRRPWTLGQVRRRSHSYAATLVQRSRREVPRVALLLDNSVSGACVDLACLTQNLFITPLGVHTSSEHLAWILERLRIGIVVTDTPERQQRLFDLRRRTGADFEILATHEGPLVSAGEIRLLDDAAAELSTGEVEEILASRTVVDPDAVATVMFTSGSTGRPKGVAFSDFNLVSKRFCRAAALPRVGNDEVLLCYLPLFHTFGRFLELLAMLFWRGTYVFVGNPSAESLLSSLPEVQPTGLIGIPLRWKQIRDQALERMQDRAGEDERERALRAVVGPRLRWGLSAAGYLDPKIFRFFQNYGIELCSGFGMTEATGGITMSPPGGYIENTVGRPLPGVDVRLTDEGEMEIAGPYVARYLDPDGEDLECLPGDRRDGQEWLATGDLFRRLEDGQLSIVDRLKDIYKNDRGQTIAPRRVERILEQAAGVKRAFLVGDNRSWNVLLLVPDPEDPVLEPMRHGEDDREYFARIIAAANETLAPFERVIDFALLDRDFDADREELTPKQTYRRKNIEENFAEVIEELYRSPELVHEVDGIQVTTSRWILRDMGALETDWVASDRGLRNLRLGTRLTIGREDGGIRVGDFIYDSEFDRIDLGVLARQPRLWLGNAELFHFVPCREGWDVHVPGMDETLHLSQDLAPRPDPVPHRATGLQGDVLRFHRELVTTFFADEETTLKALEQLGNQLPELDERLATVLLSRLATLSRHPSEEVRCLAYRILLLDERSAREDPGFGHFLDSGLSFLNEESIRILARSSVGPRRLEALRRRLAEYRRSIQWPAREVVRQQLERILVLLSDFVRHQDFYYKPVRAELASWIMLEEDPELSAFADEQLSRLFLWFEERLDRQHVPLAREEWEQIAVFDADVSPPVQERMRHLVCETAFLEQAVVLAHEEESFRVQSIAPDGLWVSRFQARGAFQLLRVSVNTQAARHFDLLVVLRQDMNVEDVRQTNNWLLAIAGHPLGTRALPRFGCARPELAAMAMEFVSDLTVEERLRLLGTPADLAGRGSTAAQWRQLYVRAMTAVFRAWDHGQRRVIPGQLTPANISVPEEDFQESSLILSLADWRPYAGPLSLVEPLYRHFYRRTRAQIPATGDLLEVGWIFDAFREALGDDEARLFLTELREQIASERDGRVEPELRRAVDQSLEDIESARWVPLAVLSAVERFRSWERANPDATLEARLDLVERLVGLYRLERFGEAARYRLFADTVLADAGDDFQRALDRLLRRLDREPEIPAVRRVELSDLQATLEEDRHLTAFRRLAFPRSLPLQSPEIIAYGDSHSPSVTLRTQIVDRKGEEYEVREPMTPEEVGQLYRLFFRRRFPKAVSEFDCYLVAIDHSERVIAGVCYQHLPWKTTYMEGVVVDRAVQGRGVASALLEDFCARLRSQGVEVVQTGYFMQAFCAGRGFHLDRRWSGLVRFLDPVSREEDPARVVSEST